MQHCSARRVEGAKVDDLGITPDDEHEEKKEDTERKGGGKCEPESACDAS